MSQLNGNEVIDWSELMKGRNDPIFPPVIEPVIEYQAEPHVACILLLDTSGSMGSKGKIDKLNEALCNFKEQVCEDQLSRLRVDVCVIEFNSNVNIVVPFCPILNFNPPTLIAHGETKMATGIRYALEAAHNQVHKYHENGIECYKPFILMITDGASTEDLDYIPELISARENEGRYGHLRFHAFGVEGADFSALRKLTNRCLAIDKNDFGSIFKWTSDSMKIVSRSAVGQNPINPEMPQNGHVPWND